MFSNDLIGSLFCSSVTCESTIQPGQFLANHISGLLVQYPNFLKIHKIYIPFQSDNLAEDDWKIITISPTNKEIYYFNPRGVVSCEIIGTDMIEEPNISIFDIKQKISDTIDQAIQTYEIQQTAINEVVNVAAIVNLNPPAVEAQEPVNAPPAPLQGAERRRRRPNIRIVARMPAIDAAPPVDVAHVEPPVATNRRRGNRQQEDELIVQMIRRPQQWKCDRYPALFCPEVLLNDFDSGVACFLAMYMMAVDCPVVLKLNDLSLFRRQIAYWLATAELPC